MTAEHPSAGNHDQQLEALIGQGDRTPPVPDEAFVSRLRTALLDEVQPDAALNPPRRNSRRNSRRSFGRLAVACGIAAALLCAFLIRSPSSWAQVQEALSARPWMHLRAKLDDGSVRDNWISIPQRKAAFRVGPVAQYIDVRSDLQFDYEESRGTVVRTPVRSDQSAESILALFEQILLGNQANVSEVERAKVLDTRSRKVSDQGKEWLEIELTLQRGTHDPMSKSLERMEFRVDPVTKLPQTMTLSILDGGPRFPAEAPRQIVFEIDYPAQGPDDIYALGIPRDATLDDRVPSDDASRALKAMASGRREFDSYQAIVFQSDRPSDQPFNALPSRVVWRRGNQIRVELCMPFEPYAPYSEKPEGTSDLAWWKEQLKHFQSLPSVVCDGTTSYRAEYGTLVQTDQQRNLSWQPFASLHKGDFLSDMHMGPVRGCLPELHAYPFIEASDVSTIRLEPAVSDELPHGSLLTVSMTVPQQHAYQRLRYWLDGDRGYVAARTVYDQLEISGVEAQAGGYCVEDQYSMRGFQRSPRGFWYPAVVVREPRVKDPQKGDGAPEVQYLATTFLLDFDAELPDSLFTTQDRPTPHP